MDGTRIIASVVTEPQSEEEHEPARRRSGLFSEQHSASGEGVSPLFWSVTESLPEVAIGIAVEIASPAGSAEGGGIGAESPGRQASPSCLGVHGVTLDMFRVIEC